MGIAKKLLTEFEDKGYIDSEKYVCAEHFNEQFIVKMIRYSHTNGKCSFCGKRRNVVPFNTILELVTSLLTYYYLPAEEFAEYDEEEKAYIDEVNDTYEIINYALPEYLGTENREILTEIHDKVSYDVLISIYEFENKREKEDMDYWNEYCELVNKTNLSAEQIISISDKNDEYTTEDIRCVRSALDMIWSYCKEMHLTKTEYGLSSQYTPHNYYRCVNYLPLYRDVNSKYSALPYIPATLVGTAPAQFVEDNRMSEKGDMMFYSSDDKDTALKEVGRHKDYPDYPATVGTFNSNKKFLILDLSEIDNWKCPSIFEFEKAKKRSMWFFLKEFMERISEIKKDKNTYKATQVFTKFIQRKTNIQGIKYKSSKTGKPCYVLFVVNRDCLDNTDNTNSSRNQLVMQEVEQIPFPNE